MSDIKKWDPVDSLNTSPPPDGWPEGQPASTVNDCARAMQGAIRREWEDAAWFDWDDDLTYVSATSFDVTGAAGLTDRYQLRRRVRVTGSTTGTIYGTITDVTGTTVVTVEWDSGSLISESGLICSLGAPTVGPAISIEAVSGLQDATSPIGTIILYGNIAPPSGYLSCDGNALDSVANPEFAALFTVIGTTFGGTGADFFQKPNLRGRVPIGAGDDAPLTNRVLGVEYGEENHTLLESEMPIHTHAYKGETATGVTAGAVQVNGVGTGSTVSAGGGNAHSNMQPSVGIAYFIRYQ